MSNIKQFFGAGSGFLGIRYPKNSTEYNDVGNLSTGLTNNGRFAIKGSWIPSATDRYSHLSFTSGSTIYKGLNSALQNIWSVPLTTLGMNGWVGFWSNPVNDDLYIFDSFDSNGFSTIKKIAFANGAITTVFTSNAINKPLPVSDAGFNGIYIVPRDPANPDTTIWDAVGDASLYVYVASQLAHLTLDASTNTITRTILKVDSGVTNQDISVPFQYITSDKKILLGGWSSGLNTSGQHVIGFIVMRDGIREYVQMPFDGYMPLPEGIIANPHDFQIVDRTAVDTLGFSQQNLTRISVFGNSVIFSIDKLSATVRPTIVGRRFFDRVDFDRWLNDICDALGMPAGVPYF